MHKLAGLIRVSSGRGCGQFCLRFSLKESCSAWRNAACFDLDPPAVGELRQVHRELLSIRQCHMPCLSGEPDTVK